MFLESVYVNDILVEKHASLEFPSNPLDFAEDFLSAREKFFGHYVSALHFYTASNEAGECYQDLYIYTDKLSFPATLEAVDDETQVPVKLN